MSPFAFVKIMGLERWGLVWSRESQLEVEENNRSILTKKLFSGLYNPENSVEGHPEWTNKL